MAEGPKRYTLAPNSPLELLSDISKRLGFSLDGPPSRGAGHDPRFYTLGIPGYGGQFSTVKTGKDPIFTNPWGMTAYLQQGHKDVRRQRTFNSIELLPGQSINLLTGQMSDPAVHQKTAKRATDVAQQRRVKETGRQSDVLYSGRERVATLSDLDNYYWGDVRTNASQGLALTGTQLAQQTGLQARGLRGAQRQLETPKSVPVTTSKRVRLA